MTGPTACLDSAKRRARRSRACSPPASALGTRRRRSPWKPRRATRSRGSSASCPVLRHDRDALAAARAARHIVTRHDRGVRRRGPVRDELAPRHHRRRRRGADRDRRSAWASRSPRSCRSTSSTAAIDTMHETDRALTARALELLLAEMPRQRGGAPVQRMICAARVAPGADRDRSDDRRRLLPARVLRWRASPWRLRRHACSEPAPAPRPGAEAHGREPDHHGDEGRPRVPRPAPSDAHRARRRAQKPGECQPGPGRRHQRRRGSHARARRERAGRVRAAGVARLAIAIRPAMAREGSGSR